MNTSAPGSAPWWLRLHAGLMPDYNQRASAFWWLVVGAGAVLLVHHLWALRGLPWANWLQILVAAGFAIFVGLCPVRVPGTRQSFVAGEIFIFLLLLLQGPEAAALASALEAVVGAWRTSRRWTSRLISPAVALLSMALVGLLLEHGVGPLAGIAGGPDVAARLPLPLLLLAMTGLAALNFMVTSQLIGAVPRLKKGDALWHGPDLVGVFRWVGVAYLGSAVVATLLFAAYRQAGVPVLMAVMPVLVLLILALHFYGLQQQTAEAMRQAAARAAEQAEAQLQALKASELRFNRAFTHAAIGMALLGLDGRLLQANPAFRQLMSLDGTQRLPARFQDLLDDEMRALFDQALARQASRAAPTGEAGAAEPFQAFQLELRCRKPGGQGLWALVHCAFFQEPEGDAPRLILQLQDISARRQVEAGLHRLAFHDSLTGLPNRRQFLSSLGTAVEHHLADGKNSYALLYLDFDRFKLVNDSLGHKAGDELLVALAQRIQENLRPSDVVGRLGGDEFAVLVPQLHDERDALQLADRLLQALRRPFRVAGHALFASASIGITFSRFGYANAEDALHDADAAMYQAKSAGKGRWAMFTGRQGSPPLNRSTMEEALRQAIEQGELSVAYQPLVELASGRLCGFEALVRWVHPTSGAVEPASFIPLAEESGLITALSDFVLDQACRQLQQWQRLAPVFANLTMCVNLSGHDLASRNFVARVQRALQGAGLAPEHLVLELTEDAVMTHLDSVALNLSALRNLGVRLSVDDFGTGYSSLSRLARLPIDSFKIDRSFVQELASADAAGDRGHDSAVVRALVNMGEAMGKTVVAEGIETAQQAEQLRRLGAAGLLGQGYHLSEPLTATDATAWLQARRGDDAPLH